MSKSASDVKKFTGKHMLLIMVCMFGVIISVNMTMAYFATQSWTGLVVKNSYVESQKFNKYLEDGEKQDKLGWKSDLTSDKGLITLSFHDKAGQPIDNLQITAIAQRPVHEHEDKVLQLSLLSDGKYSHKNSLSSGLWNIKVVARGKQKEMFKQIYQIEIR